MKPTTLAGRLIIAALLVVPLGLGAQSAQDREAQAATFLVQADDAYGRGDYQKAIADYLLVVQVSGNKMNLSRAHMGLSLSYFYLNDIENAKKHILKTLEIDPQKEVSPLFHPQTFVDLFAGVRKENEDRLALVALPTPADPAPKATEPKAQPELGLDQEVIPQGAVGEGNGHFEVGVHYTFWSVDPVKGAFEDTLTDRMAREIRESITEKLNEAAGGGLVQDTDDHGLSFSSEGSNFGLEVRYYPLGRQGSMSVGFSLEKTNIKLLMKGPVTRRYEDGSAATVEGDAYVETNPWTTNLSFRWDIVPSWKITPYAVLGFGIGPLGGTAAYVYSGNYRKGGDQLSISGEETKTFDELRDEEEFDLERFLILHTAIGVKGQVYKGIVLSGEVGFWDGLMFRAGAAYRF